MCVLAKIDTHRPNRTKVLISDKKTQLPKVISIGVLFVLSMCCNIELFSIPLSFSIALSIEEEMLSVSTSCWYKHHYQNFIKNVRWEGRASPILLKM